MARSLGTDGVVKAVTTGGTPAAVGEIKLFSLEESNEPEDVTVIGDTARRRDAGLDDWSVTLEANYDSVDEAQADIYPGQKVDLEIYPESETSGKTKRTGTGIVRSTSHSNEVNGVVPYTMTIEADGPLARDTVV